MPSGYFSTPLIFLIEILFSLYIGILALRIIMQWAHWEYSNPLVQLIIRATQLPVKFLRKFIPPLGRWDSATILLLVILTFIKLLLIGFLQSVPLNFVIVFRWMLADILSLFITLFSASIIIQVILSWVAPHNSYNPITPLISRMNAPLLNPIKRLLPPMGGLDLSPLVAIIGLQILAMLTLPLLMAQY
ncbi:MAG: YggT family protein [Gammaproteobacteria bacterium]|nr:MAG: YggT family protein [Gammaproteobacteria bacterium]RLA00139.1 MAG: YggT family protein [Gammaproteobacteria bacterium]